MDSLRQQVEALGNDYRRGTGLVFPTTFHPPSFDSTPEEIFKNRIIRYGARPPVSRFIHIYDSTQFIVFCDGICLDHDKTDPKASWTFIYTLPGGIIKGRVEMTGPFGDQAEQTSQRAQLRAVVAALRFRPWSDDGFKTLVLATESKYVVYGATSWVRDWMRKDWKTSANTIFKNRDLWLMMLGEIEKCKEKGLEVKFWHIGGTTNALPKQAATLAAGSEKTPGIFQAVV
ncbi:RNase H domain protein [Hypoxylon crocopeplum]|nr:RNase H domain protein [Hypoxylon crocopeplum]